MIIPAGVLNFSANSRIISSVNGAASIICCNSFSVNNILAAKALASSSIVWSISVPSTFSKKISFFQCKIICAASWKKVNHKWSLVLNVPDS